MSGLTLALVCVAAALQAS